MYYVTITNGNDQRIIHDHRGASNAQKLPEGVIVDAENSISSFTFTIYPNNAGYESLNANTTQIKVRNTKKSRDDFVGRVLQVKPEMDSNGVVRKTVICEDRLGYLHDSIQPFSETQHYDGDNTRTGLEEFIDVLLANHNAQVEPYKRIYRGTVTVKPFESSNAVTKGLNWQSTFDAIREKLLNSFGGFIRLRETAGVLYLDYLESIGATRSTTIEVGRNMRSVSKEIDPSGIITRLVPLGAKLKVQDAEGNEVESEERLTISSINNGVEYIESELYAQQFGIKYGTVIFDDVTVASNLLQKGTDWLASNNGLAISYDVDALDLSLLGLDIDDFVLYDSYPVKNHLIGTNEMLKIIKKTTNVIEPQNSSFEMGSITKRLSDMIIDEMLNVGATNGVDGKNSYLHIRYSANADGTDMTERPTDTTKYVGMHISSSVTAPSDPTSYEWSLIRGNDGNDGADGIDGKDGKDGKDGTSYYTWIKYADSPTSGMSDNPEGKKYIGIAYNKTSLSESASYSAYTWSLIKGEDGSDGINGVDGTDGKTYYTWIKYADDARGTNMANDPTGKFYIGIAYNKETPTESNSASDYAWSLYRGSDGIDGVNGKDGANGVGIKKVDNYYLASNLSSGVTVSTSGWTTSVQVVSSARKYLWNYEAITYTDDSTTTTQPCIIGNYAADGSNGINGQDGIDGQDGVGIAGIYEYYARSNSNSTAPTSWSTNVPILTATYKYLWNYEEIIFTDNTTKETAKRVIGVYGDTGAAGKDGTTYYTWIKYADSPTSGMSDDPEGKKYIGLAYNKTSFTESTAYGDYSWSLIKGEDGSDGVNGVDGKDGKEYYTWIKYADDAYGRNMTNDPTGKFYIGIAYNKETSIESNVASDYTWSLFRGADGVNGKDGSAGVGVKAITNYYLASAASSGVTTSTSGWTETVQSVTSAKKYLWNYEKVTFTDNSSTSTTPCIIGNYASDGANGKDGVNGTNGQDGVDGNDGVGISTIQEYYARSTSNTTIPTSWDTTVPTLTATYKYLWNFEVITFTDNTTKDTAERVIGVYGDKGDKGDQGIQGPSGADGQTLYTWLKYADTPTSGMSNYPDGKTYIGLAYNKTTSTESNNYSDYSWSLIKGADGADGARGPQGIQGPSGADGRSLYTWLKYADTPTSGMSDSPDGKTYIGLAYNKSTSAESSNYSDYTWSLIKGEDGKDGARGPQGVQGPAGADGKSLYTWIKYADDAWGNGMSQYPDGKTYIGLAYNKTTSTESNTVSDYTWSLIKGEDGKDGADGAQGPQGVQGPAGVDGKTLYTWIRYADDAFGNGMSQYPDGKLYIGLAYNKETATESNKASDYAWSLIKGADGKDGVDGTNGKDGVNGTNGKDGVNGKDGQDGADGVGVERITPRYAVGTSSIVAPSTPTIAGWSIAAPALAYGEYLWCSYYVQYTDGTNAWTEPFHARSADQINQAASEPENPTAGTLWLDTSETPYSLKRFNGTSWDVLADYSNEFEEVYTYVNTTVSELSKTAEGLVASVAEETVSKSVYEEFTTLVKNILKMETDGTTMIFQTINEAIQDVGDTEASHYAQLLTYIRFSDDGIEIGKQGNAITMRLDNDSLDFYNNGTRVAYMSDNTLYITDGRFTRSVRIGNYGFIPEANGSVSFTYLGGES